MSITTLKHFTVGNSSASEAGARVKRNTSGLLRPFYAPPHIAHHLNQQIFRSKADYVKRLRHNHNLAVCRTREQRDLDEVPVVRGKVMGEIVLSSNDELSVACKGEDERKKRGGVPRVVTRIGTEVGKGGQVIVKRCSLTELQSLKIKRRLFSVPREVSGLHVPKFMVPPRPEHGTPLVYIEPRVSAMLYLEHPCELRLRPKFTPYGAERRPALLKRMPFIAPEPPFPVGNRITSGSVKRWRVQFWDHTIRGEVVNFDEKQDEMTDAMLCDDVLAARPVPMVSPLVPPLPTPPQAVESLSPICDEYRSLYPKNASTCASRVLAVAPVGIVSTLNDSPSPIRHIPPDIPTVIAVMTSPRSPSRHAIVETEAIPSAFEAKDIVTLSNGSFTPLVTFGMHGASVPNLKTDVEAPRRGVDTAAHDRHRSSPLGSVAVGSVVDSDPAIVQVALSVLTTLHVTDVAPTVVNFEFSTVQSRTIDHASAATRTSTVMDSLLPESSPVTEAVVPMDEDEDDVDLDDNEDVFGPVLSVQMTASEGRCQRDVPTSDSACLARSVSTPSCPRSSSPHTASSDIKRNIASIAIVPSDAKELVPANSDSHSQTADSSMTTTDVDEPAASPSVSSQIFESQMIPMLLPAISSSESEDSIMTTVLDDILAPFGAYSVMREESDSGTTRDSEEEASDTMIEYGSGEEKGVKGIAQDFMISALVVSQIDALPTALPPVRPAPPSPMSATVIPPSPPRQGGTGQFLRMSAHALYWCKWRSFSSLDCQLSSLIDDDEMSTVVRSMNSCDKGDRTIDIIACAEGSSSVSESSTSFYDADEDKKMTDIDHPRVTEDNFEELVDLIRHWTVHCVHATILPSSMLPLHSIPIPEILSGPDDEHRSTDSTSVDISFSSHSDETGTFSEWSLIGEDHTPVPWIQPESDGVDVNKASGASLFEDEAEDPIPLP
ncbi:hypothetical protein A0H81_11075 [Grifola frondosa]|uniref:Uncharacterized protein n=1 Tax=Grifola frondosa TaxID=5627 RepID=A0A1C7LVE9_GRIFR|nr:hypothetical protein A0H81_11075 [Grifola frondosa]